MTTFYKSFGLIPRGKNSITICLGTACHVKGGAKNFKGDKKSIKDRAW
ncbi:MAG: NAD(P)H-dependent oxidoreductase subunit E [Thermodesulfobacteriota bacterium]